MSTLNFFRINSPISETHDMNFLSRVDLESAKADLGQTDDKRLSFISGFGRRNQRMSQELKQLDKKTKEIKKNRPFVMNSEQELQPYRRFSKIYGEMKYARKFPQQSKSFLDLPSELRVKVFRCAFVFEDPIEFFPEIDSTSHDYHYRKVISTRLSTMIKRRNLNLGFLRTCRLVHAEGSEVFYGENDFRFSAVNGHMLANLFVRKIYKQHFQWLTKLTIAMPFRSCVKDRYWSNQNPWCNRTYAMVRSAVPFSSWNGRDFTYEESFEHLVWNLLRAERFEKLTLVLPEWYDLEDDRYIQEWYNLEGDRYNDWHGNRDALFEEIYIWKCLTDLVHGKKKLQVDIVRLCGGGMIMLDPWVSEADSWKAVAMRKSPAYLVRKLKTLADAKVSVEIKGAYVKENGDWRTIDDLPESVLLPPQQAITRSS